MFVEKWNRLESNLLKPLMFFIKLNWLVSDNRTPVSLDIKTEWRVIQGTPAFFNITKKMHNAVQGEKIHLDELDTGIYERVVYENSLRNYLDLFNSFETTFRLYKQFHLNYV